MKSISASTAIAILTGFLPVALQAAAPPKPNIIYILADDLGYAGVEFNGGQQIMTPNLNKLAAAGSVLGSFYVQPVCSPTRASLLSVPNSPLCRFSPWEW